MLLKGHSGSLKLVPLGAVSYSPSIVTMAVSVAVCEIFSVKKWCDLENKVMIRLRSLKMAPFHRSHTSFLYTFHSNYGAILYRLRDLATYWWKIAKFLYPSCIYRPHRLWLRRNFVKMFDVGDTRMIGQPYAKTRSSAVAERPRDATCHWIFC